MCATRVVILSLAVLCLSHATVVPDVEDSVLEQDDTCIENTEGSCSVELRQMRVNAANVKRHYAGENSEAACWSFNTRTAECQWQGQAHVAPYGAQCYPSSSACENANPGAGNCKPYGAPTCAGSQLCFYDPSCSSGGLGCNAGGKGQNCRFCNGPNQVSCPSAPTVPTPAPTWAGAVPCYSYTNGQCQELLHAVNAYCYSSMYACQQAHPSPSPSPGPYPGGAGQTCGYYWPASGYVDQWTEGTYCYPPYYCTVPTGCRKQWCYMTCDMHREPRLAQDSATVESHSQH